MVSWTEVEFQRVAHATRISERVLEACRDVLVSDRPRAEVAAEHRIFTSQLSRALTVLRDKQAEMVESAKALESSTKLLQDTAAKIAKSIFGQSFPIRSANQGKTYEGPVIVNTHGFVVQKVGRSGVLHDLGDLQTLPPLNKPLLIVYPPEKGKAKVTELGLEKAPAKDRGR